MKVFKTRITKQSDSMNSTINGIFYSTTLREKSLAYEHCSEALSSGNASFSCESSLYCIFYCILFLLSQHPFLVFYFSSTDVQLFDVPTLCLAIWLPPTFQFYLKLHQHQFVQLKKVVETEKQCQLIKFLFFMQKRISLRTFMTKT